MFESIADGSAVDSTTECASVQYGGQPERNSFTCEFFKGTVLPNGNHFSFCGKTVDREELLYYSRQGYKYDLIILSLYKFHGIEISFKAIKKRYNV